MPPLKLKKFFLYLLIGSVAASAAVGILVILFGNFGELETKILLTTLAVTVTSILGLACGAYLETGRGRILPLAGIALAIVSAILWITLVWYGTAHTDYFAKALLTINLLAAACSHLSLLSLARLERRFLWAHYAAQIAVWSLTAILLWQIWVTYNAQSDFVARGIGVLSIVVGALTLLTPVFHRLSQQPDAGDIDAEIARLKARIEELEKQKAGLPGEPPPAADQTS